MTCARFLPLSSVAVVLFATACTDDVTPVSPEDGGGAIDCPTEAEGVQSVSCVVYQGDRYDYVLIPSGTDPRTHPRFAPIWATIRVQQGIECWQEQNGTNNLQFFENPAFGPGPRYRFVGTLDTEAGALLVHSVGCYVDTRGRAYPAAVVTTWTGDLELLAITGDDTIDVFIGYQGDFPLITRYVATTFNCL